MGPSTYCIWSMLDPLVCVMLLTIEPWKHVALCCLVTFVLFKYLLLSSLGSSS
jgi:hypothetical protein